MDRQYDLIWAVVDRDFADEAMTAARAAGARGGTIVFARGSGSKDTEPFFGVKLVSSKEILLIVVEREVRAAVMQAIYKKAGGPGVGNAVAFTLPVEDVIGIGGAYQTDDPAAR